MVMNLNDVLTGRSTEPSAPVTTTCRRCGQTAPIGWTPSGPTCESCARDIYCASMEVAALGARGGSPSPETPAWLIRILVRMSIVLFVTLFYQFC
jgi:hypothetical protein